METAKSHFKKKSKRNSSLQPNLQTSIRVPTALVFCFRVKTEDHKKFPEEGVHNQRPVSY
jgi:hypothetical protein